MLKLKHQKCEQVNNNKLKSSTNKKLSKICRVQGVVAIDHVTFSFYWNFTANNSNSLYE